EETIDALIEDKVAPSAWGEHLGRSSSPLVNASTWALMITGAILRDDRPDEADSIAAVLRGAMRRLGEPVIRTAVSRAMRELGRQFVLGRDIGEAMDWARRREDRGFAYSYDMLGEAARTAADAERYFDSYAGAIDALAGACVHDQIRRNPGISIKLSALHPRYEPVKRDRVLAELVPRVLDLSRAAKAAGMGLNIDAEEAERLDLSLDVIEAVLADPSLAGWDGFGVVVQAYGKRARPLLDWLYALAENLDRRLMCRLVKGAYWDTEIKRGQVLGLNGFPVFTRKPSTDVSYIACAQALLERTDRLYPQFATHNAHTVAAVLELAGGRTHAFEFQRLHGMGKVLHDLVQAREGTACRIYAPVGAHRDLLAYLVRRLLENGANSSFVNQIVDETVPVDAVAADPFAKAEGYSENPENPMVRAPAELFRPSRRNSKGWDIADPVELRRIEEMRGPFRDAQWRAMPLIAGDAIFGPADRRVSPFSDSDVTGGACDASADIVAAAIEAARPWDAPANVRAAVLEAASDLYESYSGELFALLAREAGKTLPDCVSEFREAVDFLRYYAAETRVAPGAPPRGIVACISPWNFPLAIFTGQVAAALAAGNAALAKPAEQTPLIAARAVQLLHRAGVPPAALQFLPGDGATVGAALTSDPRIGGVWFTGSIDTARSINRAMARNLTPDAPLVAETGGINAMIIDSAALPEQAVRNIVASAYQSAGQRCSALRVLYLQEDVADGVTDMLCGAMDELRLGDPWDPATDIGPVIDRAAQHRIAAHIDAAAADGRLLKRCDVPSQGLFVGPTAVRVDGIADVTEEIFGPVLHVATFRADDLASVVDDINRTGFGLTFGLHTRIDDRVQWIVDHVRAGNIYVNRNQIGAVVGSQPFGGEGLSGTGPKAGGPFYLPRFRAGDRVNSAVPDGPAVSHDAVQDALDALPMPPRPGEAVDFPGPTGESNRMYLWPRGRVLCLGPTAEDASRQRDLCLAAGCAGLAVAPGVAHGLDGRLDPDALRGLSGFDAVIWWGDDPTALAYRRALAARTGPILPLCCGRDVSSVLELERHVCVDTTAAGGNASLLAGAAD
ncbi:MAG: bifunctional proline dehydrogenase/L-glutamate gamma-semialdehyde dehydrogenase PutA, partial [Alphaproteobacteria bacterium]